MIGCWHHTVVCPSVCDAVHAAEVSEQVNGKCPLADVERGVFILGTCRSMLLATEFLATFKINNRSFDQCAECGLLKFVQNQIRAKDAGVNKIRVE